MAAWPARSMVRASTGTPLLMSAPDQFRYDSFTIDAVAGTIDCSYSTSTHSFTESLHLRAGGRLGRPGAWLPPPGSSSSWPASPTTRPQPPRSSTSARTATTPEERAFLRATSCTGSGSSPTATVSTSGRSRCRVPTPARAAASPTTPAPGRPLVPFGGGIDSIVTVDAHGRGPSDAALCVVHPPDERFAAIEDAAALTGLPVTRIARADRSPGAPLGRARASSTATCPSPQSSPPPPSSRRCSIGRDAVVLSNEWSASAPTLCIDGRPVNHQWSKGADSRRVSPTWSAHPGPAALGLLLPATANRALGGAAFARLTTFHGIFRSCNRAFHQDPADASTTGAAPATSAASST